MAALTFRVHSVSEGSQMASIEYEGHPVVAAIPSLAVELVWDGLKEGREHGSLVLRGVGRDMEWMRETFVQDGEVEVAFSKK